MKPYLAIALGLITLLAPLWTLSGFVTVPEYRTGTIADFATALIVGATLYGGVFIGVIICRLRQKGSAPFKATLTFLSGMAGAMAAITLALIASFLVELVSTGRLMRPGQTPALLPVFYIVGGILSAFIAAGIALLAQGLSASRR